MPAQAIIVKNCSKRVILLDIQDERSKLVSINLMPSEIRFLKYFNRKRNGVKFSRIASWLYWFPRNPKPMATLVMFSLVEEEELPNGDILYECTQDGIDWMELYRAREKKFWIPTTISIIAVSIAFIALIASIISILLQAGRI